MQHCHSYKRSAFNVLIQDGRVRVGMARATTRLASVSS